MSLPWDRRNGSISSMCFSSSPESKAAFIARVGSRRKGRGLYLVEEGPRAQISPLLPTSSSPLGCSRNIPPADPALQLPKKAQLFAFSASKGAALSPVENLKVLSASSARDPAKESNSGCSVVPKG